MGSIPQFDWNPPDAGIGQLLSQLPNVFWGGIDRGRKLGQDMQRQRLLDEATANGVPSLQQLATIGARTGDMGAALQALGLAEQGGMRDLQRQKLQFEMDQAKQTSAERARINQALGFGGGPAPAPAAPSGGGAFPKSLIASESGGNWQAQNNVRGAGGMPGHFGRLQFGQARLQEAAAAGAIPQGTTPQQFMASPELQQRAEQWHFADIDAKIKANGLDQAIGQTINGVPITLDGMRAVAHLGGSEGLRKFITSGGRYNPSDANGTSLLDYLGRHAGATQASAPDGTLVTPAQMAQTAQQPQAATPQAPAQASRSTLPPDDPYPQYDNRTLMGFMRGADEGQRTIIKSVIDRRQRFADDERRLQQTIEAENRRLRAQVDAEDRRAMRQAPTTKQIKQADGSEVSVQWDSQTERWVPLKAPEGGNAVTAPTKLTEQQSKDVGFYNRGIKVVDRLEKQDEALTDRLSAAGASVPLIGNTLKRDAYRQAEQTGRELLAVILRKDTGAAVTDQEMQLYGDMYLPKPGDDATTIQQKRAGRRTAIEGIRMGLGTAEILFRSREAMEAARRGGSAPQAGGQASPASPAQPNRTSKGVTWSIEP